MVEPRYPQGPGFLIFFQNPITDVGGGGAPQKQQDPSRQLILRDDQEIMEIAQIIIASGVLDGLD